MISSRIQGYLIHPAFLSFILWIIVILVFPPVFSKYRITKIKDEFTGGNMTYIFSDLDSDGNSEKISIDLNDQKQTKIIFTKRNRILDQYDLKYQPAGGNPVYIGDFNNDGCKECYILTMSEDSIYLNIIDPMKTRKIISSGRFIDFRRRTRNSVDAPVFIPVGMIANPGSKIKNFVFVIKTGYSLQPRNVYRYSILKDSIIKSPESGAVIINCILHDINNDSIPELLLSVMATGNLSDTFPFSDLYSWLIVLNDKLNFLFPPIRFNEKPSRLTLIPFKLNNRTLLVSLNDYYGSGNFGSTLSLFDQSGKKILEKPLLNFEGMNSNIFTNENNHRNTFFFLKNRDAEIEELDSAFRVVNTFKIPGLESDQWLSKLDADEDGRNEMFFQGSGNRSMVIVRDNFKDPVSFQYANASGFPIMSPVLNIKARPMIYLQFDGMASYIRYSINPLYYLKYPFFVLLYFSVFLFITIISRIQKYRLSLKQETEKKMASLQMKAIKNQIDPHFTMNILNAIGSLYATETDREKADYIFGKYSRLIRQTVISSDQIIVSLAEELDFVKNYIDLELFRCDNSFEYNIDIEKDVDTGIKVPRMLIHTFVENAIKYGVRNRSEGGLLKILLQKTDSKCRITIEDNGPGLRPNGISASGTGKGLVILNELIDLYYKLEKAKITYTLQPISESGTTNDGTRATIIIHSQKL